MNLLCTLLNRLELNRRERAIYRELVRLDERSLADIGLGRADLWPVARLAARRGHLDASNLADAARGGRTAADVVAPRLTGYGLGLRPA